MEYFQSAVSIFSSAAEVSRAHGKAQAWIRAWVGREDGKGAAAEQGSSPLPPPQDRRRAQLARGAPLLAPEFDGVNCFETIVWH